MTDTASPRWINALCEAWPGRVALLETHISWVLLTGRYAYKIKKPVNLGFLDFSTLEKRRYFCDEELRLNRRLAPQLYLEVVTLNGSADHPHLGGSGPVLDYAVKMIEFPRAALASTVIDAAQLCVAHIDALAATMAAFHSAARVAVAGSAHGTAQAVFAAADENFTQLASLLAVAADQSQLAELRAWTARDYAARSTLFNARQAAGAVRECHGDLHLGNLALLDGKLTPFDCIEFNPALRWIDVMNDIAFLMMDLEDHGRADFAWRFLNAYLDITGGHSGLCVLRFYLAYRALVRTKIHALRAQQAQHTTGEHERLLAAARQYLVLAQRYARGAPAALILLHGLSGSGKSVVAQAIAEQAGALRLRADVERKRLAGLAAQARSGSGLATGIYTAERTRATYERLADLARMSINAGWLTVIDATFLKRAQRDQFRALAAACRVRCVVIDVAAPEALLRARVAARDAGGSDASEADQAVLTAQLAAREPLTADEARSALRVDSSQGDAAALAACAVAALQQALQGSVSAD